VTGDRQTVAAVSAAATDDGDSLVLKRRKAVEQDLDDPEGGVLHQEQPRHVELLEKFDPEFLTALMEIFDPGDSRSGQMSGQPPVTH
jgi:hypothetical protein